MGSGSGCTKSLMMMAAEAQRQGAKLLLFTTNPTSPLAELANQQVVIPAPSYQRVGERQGHHSVQPLGTLFEQSLFIVCDCLILGLMQRTGVNVSQMAERHANLE
jgi:6-phospho-3-hexuloisomerase